MKKTLCFDLDNVICTTKNNNYQNSQPKKKVINFINQLYSEGYIIKIFTARFMGRNNDNISRAKKEGYKLTLNQLSKWKLNYHKLIFGKPSYDLFIDDKSLFFKKNWISAFRKALK
jgi:capsule biosynthesis phosphatase